MEEIKNPQLESNSYEVELNALSDTIGFITSFYNTDNISQEDLKQYIQYPMLYNRQIRNISKRMYNLHGLYGRTVDKMVAAPTLDNLIIPHDTSKKAKKRADYLNFFFNKINHKLSTRDILHASFTEGMYVAILRDTKKLNKNLNLSSGFVENLDKLEGLAISTNVMLQPLNRDYVKFIGFMNGDYVCAFDMQYFDQFKHGGLVAEIKNYPTEFIKAYNDYRRDGTKRWFILDQKKTFAYKYRSQIDEPYGRPLGLQALNDIFFCEDYTDSQRGNLKENSGTIRWLKQPEGEKTGQCSLNKEAQQNQYDNFKNAVFSNTKKVSNKIAQTTTLVLAPNTEVGKLETDSTFLKETLTNENMTAVSTDLGLALAALNGQGEGASYSSLAVNLDLLLAEVFQMLEQIEWQYTKILNNFLEVKEDEWTQITYLKTSILNRDKQFDIAKDLYMTAGGSRLYLYAVGTGDSNTYMRLMDYEKAMKFDEKYPPHVSSYTASDSADKPNPDGNVGGRTPKKDGELKDGGVQQKTNGSNKMTRPSQR
ncbi:MAG: hypothetical protein PHX46_03950 [Bacilli bacterium]|nr:hypothetical protein [Bacilli bacterium]